MNLYLVRHGKTDADLYKIRQSPDSPLGKEGKTNVRKLGTQLSKSKFDLILTSHWKRALETSLIISKKLNIPYEIVEGIHEREYPAEVHGTSIESEINRQFFKELEENFFNLDWKYLGKGESLRETRQRAERFKKKIIKNYPENNIIVVTHGIFLRCFVAECLLPKNCEDQTYIKLFHSFSFNNAGITKLEYNSQKDLWKINYLNYNLEKGKFTL